MKISYCAFCGAKLDGGARRCSACGADMTPFFAVLEASSFAEEFKKVMSELFSANAKALEEIGKQMEKRRGVFFSVEMRSGEPPIIRTGEPEDLERIIDEMPLPEFVKRMFTSSGGTQAEFREAEVRREVREDGEVIVVEMPGVEREEDVEVSKRQNVLEVAGRAGRVVYFAQVPLDEGSMVVGSSLREGRLTVEVRR